MVVVEDKPVEAQQVTGAAGSINPVNSKNILNACLFPYQLVNFIIRKTLLEQKLPLCRYVLVTNLRKFKESPSSLYEL